MNNLFYPINIPGKLAQEKLPFDIYVHYKKQFLCFRKAQTEMGKDLFEKLRMQKISQLFINNESKNIFYGLMNDLLNSVVSGDATINEEESADILSISATTSIKRMAENPKDKAAFKSTAMTSRGLTLLLSKRPKVLKNFFLHSLMEDDLFIHSRNVCILSISLAKKMGLKAEVILNLASAALMHDISIYECSKEEKQLFYTPTEGLDKEEKRKYLQHATRSKAILDENSEITKPILELIELHELTLNEWPDLSLSGQILSLCNVYDKMVTIHRISPLTAYQDIQRNFIGSYSLKLIKALGEVIKQGFLSQ